MKNSQIIFVSHFIHISARMGFSTAAPMRRNSTLVNDPIIIRLGLSVTFWFSVGLRTRFRDHAEKIGEEIFRALRKVMEQRLNPNYITLYQNREF